MLFNQLFPGSLFVVVGVEHSFALVRYCVIIIIIIMDLYSAFRSDDDTEVLEIQMRLRY